MEIDFSYGMVSFKTEDVNYSAKAACATLFLLRIGKEGTCVRKTTLKPKTEVWMVPDEIAGMMKLGPYISRVKMERILAGLLSKKEVAEEQAAVERGLGYFKMLEANKAVEFDVKKIHVKITPYADKDGLMIAAITMTNNAVFTCWADITPMDMIMFVKYPLVSISANLLKALAIETSEGVFGYREVIKYRMPIKLKKPYLGLISNETRTAIRKCIISGIPLPVFVAMG